MACACNKNNKTSGVSAGRAAAVESTADQKARLAREAEMNRISSGVPPVQVRRTASVSQTFALQPSRLEQRAAAIRSGK